MGAFHRDRTYTAMWEAQKKASSDFNLTITLLTVLIIIWLSESSITHLPLLDLSLKQDSAVCCTALFCTCFCARFVWFSREGIRLFAVLVLAIKTMPESEEKRISPYWMYPSVTQMLQIENPKLRLKIEEISGGHQVTIEVQRWRLWLLWFLCVGTCGGLASGMAVETLGWNFPTVTSFLVTCVFVFGNLFFARWSSDFEVRTFS